MADIHRHTDIYGIVSAYLQMKIILMLLISLSAVGQRGLTIMSMDVLETDIKGKRSCYDSITVVWGMSYDTLAFHYNDKLIKLWSLKENSKDFRSLREMRLSLKTNNTDESIILLQDDIEDKWLFRLSKSESGIIIFLNNLSRGRPYILFDFNNSKLCE